MIDGLEVIEHKEVAEVQQQKTDIIQPVDMKMITEFLDTTGLTKQLLPKEKATFVNMAQLFGLNPFKREIYCTVYGTGDYRTCAIVTGYEVYLKRAERTGKMDGWECSITGKGDDMAATVTIYRKDWGHPFKHTVYYRECVQINKKTGKPNSVWGKMPSFMTKKVAIAQAFRLCFPDEFGGMPYTNDEIVNDDAQKKAEEAERKKQEFKKQQDALLFKYTDEIQKLTVEKMEDGFEKEKKTIEADAKSKIEQLKQDGAKRGDVLEKQKELEQAITDAANAKITALEKKHNEELKSIKMEGAKMLLDLTKDSTQKELDLADLEHKERVKEIETKFKDEADLKARLLKQESEYYEKTRTDITREGNQKQLSEQEQLEISTLEIMSFYGAKTEEAEEQKQLAILEIQKKYAVQRLNDLISNGGSELEVNNAILAVHNIEKSLEDYSKKDSNYKIYKAEQFLTQKQETLS